MQEKPVTVNFLGPEQYLGSLPIPLGMSYEPGPGWIRDGVRCSFCFWRICRLCLSCHRKDVLSCVFRIRQDRLGLLWYFCWNLCGCCSNLLVSEKMAWSGPLWDHRHRALDSQIPSIFWVSKPYGLKSSRTSSRHCKCQHPDDRWATDYIAFI